MKFFKYELMHPGESLEDKLEPGQFGLLQAKPTKTPTGAWEVDSSRLTHELEWPIPVSNDDDITIPVGWIGILGVMSEIPNPTGALPPHLPAAFTVHANQPCIVTIHWKLGGALHIRLQAGQGLAFEDAMVTLVESNGATVTWGERILMGATERSTN